MAHYLTLLKNGQVLQKIELDQSTIGIGRGLDAALRIFDTSLVVSREHASITYRSDKYWVKNEKGKAGTKVNGVSASEWTALDQGDAIHIGDFLIIYSYGYVWDPCGPTLYSGPIANEEEQRNAMAQTMCIADAKHNPLVSLEFKDGRQQMVYKDSFTVGRLRNNTVWLPDRNVAERHAEIFVKEDQWFIRCIDQRNKVTVGKRPIKDVQPLTSGQLVGVGYSSFRFKLHKN